MLTTASRSFCGVAACAMLVGAGEVPAQAASESTLYSFAGGNGGAAPYAGLISVGSNLYGTTVGAPTGTAFKLTLGGAEKTLHVFGKGTDGADPYGVLVSQGGVFYGTTEKGGASGKGTIYKMTAAGTETVLHSFKGGAADGALPYAGLTSVTATGPLYGTTVGGGAANLGTVFQVATTGAVKVLHSFKNDGKDGNKPYGALIDVGGTLYGTTSAGGTSGLGTVFSITPAGAYKVVYSFKGNSDGAIPYCTLVDVNGTLYGTTYIGGLHHFGTVFSVTTSGSESALYSFDGPPNDGGNPYGGLVYVNGMLYGTTYYGNSSATGDIFSISLFGRESVVYTFLAPGDGANPYGTMLNVNGTLYGTTVKGGAHGDGAVFSFVP